MILASRWMAVLALAVGFATQPAGGFATQPADEIKVIASPAVAPAFDEIKATQPAAGFLGFLEGTFVVRCPLGHDETVKALTKNHNCSNCGKKSVNDGEASVICPNNHPNTVSGVTRHKTCAGCGAECRRSRSA